MVWSQHWQERTFCMKWKGSPILPRSGFLFSISCQLTLTLQEDNPMSIAIATNLIYSDGACLMNL